MPTAKKIMNIAKKMMAQQGFNGTTVSQIARKAQISTKTFYKFFTHKEALLKEIFITELKKQHNFYFNMKNWHIDWFLKINGILNFHLQELQTEPETPLLLLRERTNPALNQEKIQAKFKELTQLLASILEQAVAEQKIRPCDVEATALIISGFLDALTYEFQTKKPLPLEAAIENFCLLLRQGLTTN